MKKRELIEILKQTKYIHKTNISGKTKKELQNLYLNLMKLTGGCNDPTSPFCPKNIAKNLFYNGII
jgi:hypothetical protein